MQFYASISFVKFFNNIVLLLKIYRNIIWVSNFLSIYFWKLNTTLKWFINIAGPAKFSFMCVANNVPHVKKGLFIFGFWQVFYHCWFLWEWFEFSSWWSVIATKNNGYIILYLHTLNRGNITLFLFRKKRILCNGDCVCCKFVRWSKRNLVCRVKSRY